MCSNYNGLVTNLGNSLSIPTYVEICTADTWTGLKLYTVKGMTNQWKCNNVLPLLKGLIPYLVAKEFIGLECTKHMVSFHSTPPPSCSSWEINGACIVYIVVLSDSIDIAIIAIVIYWSVILYIKRMTYEWKCNNALSHIKGLIFLNWLK